MESEGDAGAILGVPLLGETPRLDVKLRGTGAPSSPPKDPVAAEAYHVVLAALEHALSKVGGKVVAVASAGPGDGKTLAVLNLALAARREGRKVLLVDADERTRQLSQLCRDGEQFDVIGVSHDGEEDPAGTVGRWPPPTPRPRPEPPTLGTVLQVGPSERNGHHPAEFFRSTAFGKLISFSGRAGRPRLDRYPGAARCVGGRNDRRSRRRHSSGGQPRHIVGRSAARPRTACLHRHTGDRLPAQPRIRAACLRRERRRRPGPGRAREARESVHNRRGPIDRAARAPRGIPARHREREWQAFVSPLSWRSTTAGS